MALYKTHKRHAGLSTHATCGATSQPCQATCDAVSAACPAHVLTDLGVTCSTDATTCVSGQDVVVGAVTEAYEGTACAGLVTDIAVPPGPLVGLRAEMNLNLTWSRRWRLRDAMSPRRRRRGRQRVYASRERAAGIS